MLGRKSLFPIALFLTSLGLGLTFLNEGLFHYDAVVLAEAVEKTFATGHLEPGERGRYGAVVLGSLFYVPFFIAGQNADFAIRLLGVVGYAGSVSALFLLIRELFDDANAAALGAVLLLATPFYVIPSTCGKLHGVVVGLFLTSLWLVARGRKQPTHWPMVLASSLLVLAISVREAILPLVPLFYLFALQPILSFERPWLKIDRQLLTPKYVAAAVVPFSIGLAFLTVTYLHIEFARELLVRDKTAAQFMGLITPNLARAFSDLTRSITPLLPLIGLAGVVWMGKNKALFVGVFLSLWFLLIFFYGNLAGYGVRYLDITVLPIYVGVSYVVASLRGRARQLCMAVIAGCVVWMLLFAFPMLDARRNYNGAKRFAEYVRDTTPEDALVLAMDEEPFIRYYAGRETLAHPAHPTGGEPELDAFLAEIDTRLSAGKAVYMLETGFQYDKHRIVHQLVTQRFGITRVGQKLWEDYHRPEMKLRLRMQGLYRLVPGN